MIFPHVHRNSPATPNTSHISLIRKPSEPLPQPSTDSVKLSRLIMEEPGVEGTCWFFKNREDGGHVFANILRIVCLIVIAPLYVLTPRTVTEALYNAMRGAWWEEIISPSDAVLYRAPGGSSGVGRGVGIGQYEPTGYLPQWMLKVRIANGAYAGLEQVPYAEVARTREFKQQGYTALSYDMDSAFVLFKEAGLTLSDPQQPPPGRKYSIRDRMRLSEQLLREYCASERSDMQQNADRTEYVWLDEFCLADLKLQNRLPEVTHPVQRAELEAKVSNDRDMELGRLADIFRGAARVCVFCHEDGCDHTKMDCPWSIRLFTLAEILHAQEVLTMTREADAPSPVSQTSIPPSRSYISAVTAHSFRSRIQHHAADAGKWHLYSLMQSTLNAGSITWQLAIHSLIVEAIRRDNSTGYRDHKLLGQGLNGLLPRRARLGDLKGSKGDGWEDLAWILELNQGFYNAASLAAVCGLWSGNGTGGNGWLGPPIEPTVGNERLEPLATAFPVCRQGQMGVLTPLNIIRAETIGLHPKLKRDRYGLYQNDEMKKTRIILRCIFAAVSILPLIISVTHPNLLAVAIAILWVFSTGFVGVELVVSTMFLDRSGWVFLEDKQGEDSLQRLQALDYHLKNGAMDEWGHRQLVPRWQHPVGGPPGISGILFDLKHAVFTEVTVGAIPNAMVVLAIHGSGVTCMLLNRSVIDSTQVAEKVGMSNLPPYVLATTAKAGSVCVGAS